MLSGCSNATFPYWKNHRVPFLYHETVVSKHPIAGWNKLTAKSACLKFTKMPCARKSHWDSKKCKVDTVDSCNAAGWSSLFLVVDCWKSCHVQAAVTIETFPCFCFYITFASTSTVRISNACQWVVTPPCFLRTVFSKELRVSQRDMWKHP